MLIETPFCDINIFLRPILRIPTLAIHLDRSTSADGFKFNNETHLTPMISTVTKRYEWPSWKTLVLLMIVFQWANY